MKSFCLDPRCASNSIYEIDKISSGQFLSAINKEIIPIEKSIDVSKSVNSFKGSDSANLEGILVQDGFAFLVSDSNMGTEFSGNIK